MKKLFYLFAILLLLMVGCSQKAEFVDSVTPVHLNITRSVNLDPNDFCGNSVFNNELYSIDEICDSVYFRLLGVDDTLANRIANCQPTEILTCDVLPSAIRIARAFNYSIMNSPGLISHLDSFALLSFYLFEPSAGGYVLASADRRNKHLVLLSSRQEFFPDYFFEDYRDFSIACEEYLPEILASLDGYIGRDIDEIIDAKLIQRLLLEGNMWIDKYLKFRNITNLLLEWWEYPLLIIHPGYQPYYESWQYISSITEMGLGWTQEYPYNQYFSDNGVTGSIPLCIAKLLVYEEVDALINGFHFKGYQYKQEIHMDSLYMGLPYIAHLTQCELLHPLYRYSPTTQGLSFLRHNGFILQQITQTLSETDKCRRIRDQIQYNDHPVIAIDRSNWILIEGIHYDSRCRPKYLFIIDENKVGINNWECQSYDLSNLKMYEYELDTDIHIN